MNLSEMLGEWVPGTESTRVVVTRNPFARALEHLDYLIAYPFGCAEQTASRTRALMYMERFLDAKPDNSKLPALTRAGIERLLAMQTRSGGFAFWPGGEAPDRWASAYVLDLFWDLREEGFEVPTAALERGLRWAAEVVERSRRDSATPYLLYVLAKARRPNHARIEATLKGLSYSPGNDGFRREQRFLLLAAKYLSGDRRVETKLKSFEEPTRTTASIRDRFYSDRRARALRLAVLVELFGAEPWLKGAAEQVAAGINGSSASYTTQELAWALTGLGRFVGPVAQDLPDVTLTLGARAVAPTSGTHGFEILRASERGELRLEVDLDDGPAPYVVLSSEGVRPNGVWTLGGQGLDIRRSLVDERGEPLGERGAQLGQRVYSVVRVKNLNSGPVRDVALTDPVPGGFEVLNPRLQGAGRPAGLSGTESWSTEYENYLDDRAEAFGELAGGQEATFVTPLRAVSKGVFVHLPASLEAMYDPDLWARVASTPVQIAEP